MLTRAAKLGFAIWGGYIVGRMLGEQMRHYRGYQRRLARIRARREALIRRAVKRFVATDADGSLRLVRAGDWSPLGVVQSVDIQNNTVVVRLGGLGTLPAGA